MKSNRISGFLGNTSKKYQMDSFIVSLVLYNVKVSEEWHYHENIHLSSILAGGNRETRKNNDFIVIPGRLMTYREGEIHRNRSTAHPSLNLNIELLPEFFNDQNQFSNLQHNEYSYLSTLKIYNELLINDSFSNQSIHEMVLSLFSSSSNYRTPKWIDELKTLLNDRWQEFVTLEEISNELRLHPFSISKGFSKYTGITISNYMRMVKVNRAVRLVLDTAFSFTEIAHTCGFSDQSHMYRLFKIYTGFSPKTLRQIRNV